MNDYKYDGELGIMFSKWSERVADAENMATGTHMEIAVWAEVDELWDEYQSAIADYDAAMDAASNRFGY